jgi:hypothetical protein
MALITRADFAIRCDESNLGVVTLVSVSTAVPEKPRNLAVVGETWESVQLSWQPGFDGGYAQNYEVTVSASSRAYSMTHSAGEATVYNITGEKNVRIGMQVIDSRWIA